jgi:hypothetical protein
MSIKSFTSFNEEKSEKWIKDAKGIVSELKKHKSELKRFI